MTGIRAKLLFFTLLIILLVSVMQAGFFFFVSKKNTLSTFEREKTSQLHTLSDSLARSLYFRDLNELSLQVASLLLAPEAVSVYILDERGVVLTDGTKTNLLSAQPIADPFAVWIRKADDWVHEHDGQTLKIGGPIRRSQDAPPQGYLYASFSLANLRLQGMADLKHGMLASACVSALAALLAILFARHFTRPLTTLTLLADRIGASATDVEIPEVGKDEILSLSRSLKAMHSRLKATNARLETKTRELDDKVREKTHKLRQSEELFRKAFETAPLCFVVLDLKRCVTEWNEQAEKTFGWSRNEVLGKNLPALLFAVDARAKMLDATSCNRKSEGLVLECFTKNGTTVTCHWSCSSLYNAEGQAVGALALGLDVTDRSRPEEARGLFRSINR